MKDATNNGSTLKRVLISAYLCNMLEMYDFIVFGLLIPLTSPLYFPSENKSLSILLGVMTFSIGYIMRPLGALFFGYIGDTWGRKKALLSSIFGMAIATSLLGLLPTYATWGMAAPLCVVGLRMIQGFCLGGEGQGAMVFALEHAKGKNPGWTGGLLTTSNGMASLLAFFISMLVTSSYAPPGSWRFCYLFGAMVGVVGWYLRLSVDESPAFQAPKAAASRGVPILSVLRNRTVNFGYVFLGVGLVSALSVTGYTFINLFLTQYIGLSSTVALSFAILETVIAMMCVIVSGRICDRIGPYKTVRITSSILLLLIFPIHLLLSSGQYPLILLALILLAIPNGGVVGAIPHLVASAFPTSERYSGAAFGNNVAQAILGGTQPVIAVYLIQQTGLLWAPALYVFGLGAALWIYMTYFKSSLSSYSYVTA